MALAEYVGILCLGISCRALGSARELELPVMPADLIATALGLPRVTMLKAQKVEFSMRMDIVSH